MKNASQKATQKNATRAASWRRFLWPLSILYSAVSRARAWWYRIGIFRAKRLPGTVISVGNLTVGGTGKTPMVLWLAEKLAEEGKNTAILTRGYRGTVDAERGEPQSDEVAILRARFAGRVKIGVGADRYATGGVLARHGTDWFVLDDGYQHLKLARDADIVLIDATNPFGGGMALPAGELREPISALRRCDVVVITRCLHSPAPAIEAMIRRHTRSPIFYAATALESVLRVPRLTTALPKQDWPRARYLAFCGIGNSQAFFEDLRNWEFKIVGEHSFADHHVYTAREIADLVEYAKLGGADALLCTEKDVWNLRHVPLIETPVYCCRISLRLPEIALREAIAEAVARKQAGGTG